MQEICQLYLKDKSAQVICLFIDNLEFICALFECNYVAAIISSLSQDGT